MEWHSAHRTPPQFQIKKIEIEIKTTILKKRSFRPIIQPPRSSMRPDFQQLHNMVFYIDQEFRIRWFRPEHRIIQPLEIHNAFVSFSFDELFINVLSVFLVNHQTMRTIFLFGRLLGDRRFIRRRVRIITYFIHGAKNKRRNLSLTSEREPKHFYGSWKSRVL